ncbi:SRPBCC domain-containing protein [Streptomyces sp. ICBB 8177]|uniref:SRPBCC domain-containing protein n=1 Tax=Streptomyces sp. ICBB 8177 TaxID=563922 RepID=UPI000D680C8F|nr:SRPBCC domain-containing protein [Streptomyces sp. ICBB 8177]PWI42502.1 carbon monoxide dehydrogenase subunit G [Streptomyces sp. ICBB 8177]
MEHEAFVPFPVEVVRQALTEPDRVARCVSALQRDGASSAGTLAGRLRLRIGGSTITYRGSLRIAACDGGFEIEGEGTEARGTGAIKVALVIELDPAEGGTRMDFSGAVQADGRLTEYDEATTEASGRRLLDRFVSDLTTDLQAEPVTLPEPADPAGADASGEGEAEDGADGEDDDGVAVLGVEVPETVAEIEDDLRTTGGDGDEPPAEAAHARRTMIGRSAEEVDHAPPRGRYAPVPAPETGSATDTLRWAAPAAAALLASAVVVGRVLRRRR